MTYKELLETALAMHRGEKDHPKWPSYQEFLAKNVEAWNDPYCDVVRYHMEWAVQYAVDRLTIRDLMNLLDYRVDDNAGLEPIRHKLLELVECADEVLTRHVVDDAMDRLDW